MLVEILIAIAILINILVLLIFIFCRKTTINYIVKNYNKEQLEKWGIASKTRYAKWGLINSDAKDIQDPKLLSNLQKFRTTQLVVSDTTVVVLSFSMLFIWGFKIF